MNQARLSAITKKYRQLRIAVVGDFCLDRYLEIDPTKQETSIETGLAVHNVVNIRAQAGAAGTVLNNLAALKLAALFPVGFRGCDGEGMELEQALLKLPGVSLEHFFAVPQRRTFTYTKPLVVVPGKPPRELQRLDLKNWTPTPPILSRKIADSVRTLAHSVDGIIVLDQVESAGTGVITREVLAALGDLVGKRLQLFIIADSRSRLAEFPPLVFKVNGSELADFVGGGRRLGLVQMRRIARELSVKNGRAVFVTLARHGIIGALPSGEVAHAPAFPVRGPIDVVGAGDAVTANITAAVLCGATLAETLELANAAASVVIHKLGTTGTGSVAEIQSVMAKE
jgi:rfaE bifunctional protein kinase chain/domain